MINLYSKELVKNIYKKPSSKSEITSQIIYGEKIKILKESNNWLKIKTLIDNYSGFIKNKKLEQNFKATHKCFLIKTKIYNKKKRVKEYLPFNSRLSIKNRKNGYGEFEKGKWVKLNNLKKINYIEKDFLNILKKFKNTKYLWGGKSYQGIDCSALLQIFYLFNNKFFPRDTKDQIKFKKVSYKRHTFNKGHIIYWKGHVAVCVNKKKLIHAYGPKKRVLIMNIKDTIKIIEKTANLKVIKISKI